MSAPPIREELTPKQRRAGRLTSILFLLGAVSAACYAGVYWYDDNTQGEGIFLGVAFFLLAAAFVVWSHHLMPPGPFEEEYPDLRSPAHQEAEVLATLDRGAVGRRRVILGSLGVVGASVAAAFVSDLRTLGPLPASLGHTAWARRPRLVNQDGTPVRASDVPVDSIVSVLPEGFTTQPDAPAILIRLPPGVNHPLPGRAGWSPQGFVCYSKVCSHAGCAVNLYDRQAYELVCPCHQSTFAANHGAVPVFGPAGGPLVQLPLTIDPDGTLRAAGDFSGPPGPVYWHQGEHWRI